jgi:tryptophan synthase alpha chain
MTTIFQKLNTLNHKCALIPFITAGDPDLISTEKALKILDKEGADIIEIGLPYSDPLADGPIIQEASKKALIAGVTLDKLLDLLTNLNLNAPIILFTYYNPMLARGINRFLADVSRAGIKGLIIPDLPLEEADYIIDRCINFSLELILLITPVSSSNRITKILQKSQGVIYIVSSTGVTGLRKEINKEMKGFIQKIRSESNSLLILGFGISTENHVKCVLDWNINGIVIGSAFVRCLSSQNKIEGLCQLKKFCALINDILVSN